MLGVKPLEQTLSSVERERKRVAIIMCSFEVTNPKP